MLGSFARKDLNLLLRHKEAEIHSAPSRARAASYDTGKRLRATFFFFCLQSDARFRNCHLSGSAFWRILSIRARVRLAINRKENDATRLNQWSGGDGASGAGVGLPRRGVRAGLRLTINDGNGFFWIIVA